MKNIYFILLLPAIMTFNVKTPLLAQKLMSMSIFNHATALPPQGIAGPIHPGLDLGFTTLKKPLMQKSSFWLWKAGYYYHRLVHHGIQLYGEYNRVYPLVSNKLMIGWSGGLGYLHTIELHEKFDLKGDGNYARTGQLGKPHAQLSVATKLVYTANHISPFIEYRVRLATPFVNKYVPLLPSTSIHVGLFYIIQNNKTSES